MYVERSDLPMEGVKKHFSTEFFVPFSWLSCCLTAIFHQNRIYSDFFVSWTIHIHFQVIISFLTITAIAQWTLVQCDFAKKLLLIREVVHEKSLAWDEEKQASSIKVSNICSYVVKALQGNGAKGFWNPWIMVMPSKHQSEISRLIELLWTFYLAHMFFADWCRKCIFCL